MFVIWLLWLCSVALHSFVDAGAVLGGQCPAKKPPSFLNNISNVEQIVIGQQINTRLASKQQKRYTFHLNNSSPLLIKMSAHPSSIVRRLYFNHTINLTRYIKLTVPEILLPCAANGVYDLILMGKRQTTFRLEVSDTHPLANWPLLNRSTPIKVRFQNRMQKRQMIIKWSKSKLDIHAVHYCLVVNTKDVKREFCSALRESLNNAFVRNSCSPHTAIENTWLGLGDRVKKIDSDSTNVMCTGSKSQQIIRGLLPNTKYFIDIFAVHTKLRNLTFWLKSTSAWFNRTHPNPLVDDSLTYGKISAMSGASVFSYKIPISMASANNLRFIIIPCGGSQIDVKFLKQRQKIKSQKGIYKPTYITLPNTRPGERYIVRVNPSNVDEVLKANKVGIAVTTKENFTNYPEMPFNTTTFAISSLRNCNSPTIAWFSAPEKRKFMYCVIVFSTPNNNRSSIEQTNYCLDFSKRVSSLSHFYRSWCFNPNGSDKIEHFTLLNLSPGESYLVYVTAYLSDGRSLPYESLRINISKYCQGEIGENSLWQNGSFYDN